MDSRRSKIILFVIVLLGGALRLWGMLRPTLHLWDERFHALVEKNIALHGWIPTLYSRPLLPYDPGNWMGNHVWLHKPPLGLWLGGLSMKLLGVSEWAHRFPSFVLGTLSILLTFWIAARLFDEKTGLAAAFFHAVSGHVLLFTSGTYGMDNIDNGLLFFTQLAVLLWLIAVQDGKRAYVVLSGLALGLALLAKSFPALVAWGLFCALMLYPKYRTRRHLVNSLLMLAIALAVALPWQIYAHRLWPQEFAAGQANQIGHFFTPEIPGAWYLHFRNIPSDYGEFAVLSLLFALYAFWRRRTENLFIAGLWFLTPYVIFSFAQTKIITLVYYCAPAIFILSGFAACEIFALRQTLPPGGRKLVMFILTAGFLFTLRVTGEKMVQIKTGLFGVNKSSVMRAAGQIGEANAVLFNDPHYIETMFWSPLVAYPFLPGPEQIAAVLKEGYRPFVLRDGASDAVPWAGSLPTTLQKEIKWFESGREEPEDSFWHRLRRLQLKDVHF